MSSGKITGPPQTLAAPVTGFGTLTATVPSSVSQAGTLVYNPGERFPKSTLQWQDRTGQVIGQAGDAAVYSNPALSPDGKRLAVGILDADAGTRDIWIFDLDRGAKTRLTFEDSDDFNPVWSPDGTRIAYTSKGKGNRDICVRSAGGAGTGSKVLVSNVDKNSESWSGDGRLLSIHLQQPGNSDVIAMPMDQPGTQPVTLRGTRYNESGSQFSPDGRLIAYASNESGRNEIYVQTVQRDGGRWQISTDTGIQPSWRGERWISGARQTASAQACRTRCFL